MYTRHYKRSYSEYVPKYSSPTPAHAIKDKYSTECTAEIFPYVNDTLNIVVMGMQQPEKINFIDPCLQAMIKYNVKYYITFNQINRPKQTMAERLSFERMCDSKDCEFWSIPIADYQPPTENQLHELWFVLDRFHEYRSGDNKVNCVMHCTGGTGRTAAMLMSYIWYKYYLLVEKESTKRIHNLAKRLLKNFASPFEILSTLMEEPLMSYMKSQMAVYTREAEHEIFEDPVLLCKRVRVITGSCLTYEGKLNPSIYRQQGSAWISRQSKRPPRRPRSESASASSSRASSTHTNKAQKVQGGQPSPVKEQNMYENYGNDEQVNYADSIAYWKKEAEKFKNPTQTTVAFKFKRAMPKLKRRTSPKLKRRTSPKLKRRTSPKLKRK